MSDRIATAAGWWQRLIQFTDRGASPMSDRVRNAVLLVVLSVWVIVIAAYLIQEKLPDAALVGIPAGFILALGRRSNTPESVPAADPPPQTATADGDAP